MAEDGEDAAAAPRSGEPLAGQIAMNASGVSEEAREYLRKQSRLADLQIENLRKLDEYETSHLRWRRFNDQMKGALQIMVVAVGAVVVIGIGVAMWNASRAEGLVVDSFSVPPSFAAAGIAGDVAADDMTDKIAAIRDFASDHSLARSKDVREDRDQDIKVEIPETGVSLAEAWRYLRQWLGHEQHLRGSIRSLPGGQIALTVALDGADSFTLTGAPAELDKLEQQAAERVFATVDPVNIVLYWNGKGRAAETLAAARHLVSLGGDKRTMSESYSLYANMIRYIDGDARRSEAIARLAISLDPKPAPQHMELLNAAGMLGHDETVLDQARVIAGLRQEDNIGSWRTGDGVPYVWQLGAFYRAVETGDFADAAAQPCIYLCSLAEAAFRRADAEARLHDPRLALAIVASAAQVGSADPEDLAHAQYDIHAAQGAWKATIRDARDWAVTFKSAILVSGRFDALYALTHVVPPLAYALARSGDFAGAEASIGKTPLDCYDCVRARGNVDGLEKNWSGAAAWFANAVKLAPSIPFAYADWGQMLMAKGEFDAAIAKFAQAHDRGPHFADPLEMWGEALIAKNRSDLALAKFEEANKYAPHWGRLHLKWGEALLWSGDKAGAQKQVAMAAHLDLTPSEQSELARVPHG